MSSSKAKTANRAYRSLDAKAAITEHEKEKRDAQKKTARLRELRLTKEAEDRAVEALQEKKPAKKPKKRGLPEFQRER